MSEEIENLRKYLEKEMRADKLDTSLLFIISCLGLIFSVLQIFLSGRLSLIYILMPLITGFILPFWYGFLQGAVFHDLPIIRVKGWIYLYFGIFLYFIVLIPYALAKIFPDNPMTLLSSIIPLLAGYFSKSLIWKICSKIFEIFDKSISGIDDEIIELTSNSAIYFCLSGVLLILYFEDSSYLSSVGTILFIFLALITELSSWKYIKKYDKPYEIIELKKHPRIAKAFRAIGLVFFILLIFYMILPESELSLKITFLILASSSFILFMLFKPATVIEFRGERNT